MPKIAPASLTQQQQKWFASVRAGLEAQTGKSLAEWVAIAKTCPESAPRARLKWFKETHGLLQNRASYVLSEAFPPRSGWDEPRALRDALWMDTSSRAILEAFESLVLELPEVIVGQRKGYSAWSRKYQFAALRPLRGCKARLGLALAPEMDPRFMPAKNEGWSERLKSSLILESPKDANNRIAKLVRAAWEAS
jgi:Domain of unknown function (DUF4287)/Domain of unknown function (DUF5655)